MRLVGCVLAVLMAVGCNKSSSGAGASGGNGFDACDQPPSGAIAQNACPGAVGTWNNYEVIESSNSTVTSNKVWCGGTDGDVPVTQADYDSRMVSGGFTSGTDFKVSSVCASGSKNAPGGASKTRNIWQKQ